ncbi:MAG: HEAT repeat domain-containing protein, partial [Planctomycetota bacterium]
MRLHRTPVTLALLALVTTSAAQEQQCAPKSEPSVAQTQTNALQAHYARAEAELRAADTSGLSPEQRAARAAALDTLNEYWTGADFGRDDRMHEQRGVSFVDDGGRRCAVAYLLDATGETDLVQAVAETANHAYVLELSDNPDLIAWLDRVGLTMAEAARIQGPHQGSWNFSDPPAAPIVIGPATATTGSDASRRATANGRSRTGTSAAGPAAGGPDGRRSTTGGRGSSQRGSSTRGSITGDDPMEDWWRWWETNKLRFMQPNRLVEQSTGAQGRYGFGSDLPPGVAATARAELIPLLEQHLEHEDAVVRQRAVAALGRLGGADAVPQLIGMLGDGSLYVRESAILALGATGSMKAAPTLLHLAAEGVLPTDEGAGVVSTARPLALLALGIGRRHGLGSAVDGFVAAIVDGLSEDDREELGTAAMLYHTLAYNEDISAFAHEVFADESVGATARCRATESLRLSGDGADLPPLTHALSGNDLQVRRSAALAMGGFRHPLVLPRLQTAYELEKEPMTRGFILIAIGEQGGATARDFLAEVMTDGDSTSRPWAAIALGILARAGNDDVARKIIRSGLEQGSDHSARGAYMLASGIARDRAAGATLSGLVAEAKDPRQRMFAALALAMSNAPEARGALLEQIETESSPLPRVALAQALGLMGVPDDSGVLVETLRDISVPDLQELVAVALGFHGTEGSVQGLMEIVRDDDTGATARGAALDALGLMLDTSPGLQLVEASSS